MLFCNNAAVSADGTIYFTDTSTVHGIEDWKADFVELTRTGRLLRRAGDGGVDQVGRLIRLADIGDLRRHLRAARA